jgi:hypothetical protein
MAATPSGAASQLIVAGWQSLVTDNPVDNINEGVRPQ